MRSVAQIIFLAAWLQAREFVKNTFRIRQRRDVGWFVWVMAFGCGSDLAIAIKPDHERFLYNLTNR